MPVSVEVPETVEDVVGALGDDGAVVIAGGTQVMPRLNTEVTGIATLVSLRRARLGGITVDRDDATVGAATTLSQLGADDRLAFLRPVVESIASPSIRNLATVGGNLFVAQPCAAQADQRADPGHLGVQARHHLRAAGDHHGAVAPEGADDVLHGLGDLHAHGHLRPPRRGCATCRSPRSRTRRRRPRRASAWAP